VAQGFFTRRGVDVDITAFAGDAKLQQALAAGAVDMGVGGGPSLAFIAKGSPELAVAQTAGVPLGSTITVAKDSAVKTIADLKGRLVSVSTVGSQPEWFTRELSRQQGWGPDGIRIVALGEVPAQVAAMKTGQIDGVTADITSAYRMEDSGDGHILVKFGDVIPHYANTVMFATNDMMTKHPDALRAFIAGWLESAAFMRDHKDETVKIDAAVLKIPEPIVARVYDETLRMISADGRFDPTGLEVLGKSFVDMNMLPATPDMATLYTEKFLPGTKS
jgi:ABC-type nitrate/sulfonate/bicarbonate transport system substrate-binding protein